MEEVGSSRETSPLQMLEELCLRRGNMRDERLKDDRTATTRDERTAISPGTVSTARRKFEQNNNNSRTNSNSSNSSSINNNNNDNSDVESDKFARERSSTEKLRGILQSESAGSGGLSCVSLLHLGHTRQQAEEEGSGGLSKVSLLHLGTRQQPGEEEGGGLSSVSQLHLGTRRQAEEEEGSEGLSKVSLLQLGTRQLPGEEEDGGEALSPQNQIKVKI